MRVPPTSGWRFAAVVLVLALTLVGLSGCQTDTPGLPPAPTPAVTNQPPPLTQATPGVGASLKPAPTGTTRLFLPNMAFGQTPPTPRPDAIALAPPPPPAPTATPTPKPKKEKEDKPTAPSGPTNTPGPTKTPKASPTPKFPPPVDAPGASKLGLHVIRNNSQDIMEFVRVSKPRVVKGVDDLQWLKEVKQVNPSIITIGRINVADQKMEGDPAQRARDMVNAQLQQYQYDRDGVDYWEGWNEPAPKTHEEMQWYAAFEAERVRALAELGLKAAVGQFPTGVPEWDLIPDFLPAIQAAKQHGGILALHEYSAPTMQFGVGDALPGRPAAPNRGVLTLRYRYWYDDFLKPRGLAIPLAITEAGIDGGVTNRPGPAEARGWQDFGDYWRQQGLGDDPVKAYLDQLAWYDSEVRKDPYVLGYTVYTSGGPDGGWASFEINDILPTLARYLNSQH
ncbi:MAG: hypothetical protein U0768_21375 [Anaerolineae bacterium]